MSSNANNQALIDVNDLEMHFPVRGGVLNRVVSKVHAVNGVSFSIHKGEVLGVVGESGCGKSTLGKSMIRLLSPTAGSVRYEGDELVGKNHGEMMPYRKRMQIIFQDPYSSLNPRLTVRKTLREVAIFHDVPTPMGVDAYIEELILKVGLRPEAADKFPHEFSGGQRQRIGIARALACNPEFLVADEPVSALDVSIQAQVLNLLMDLKEELGLTMLFVSHDLKVIEHFCDRVLVMYLGNIVEELSCDNLHENAKHPYTRALLGANPINDPDDRRPLTVLKGDVPSPFVLPTGCAFAGRCPVAEDRCHTDRPQLEVVGKDHRASCWLVEK
ncbi:MAG: oligopeptide/dipeptide ABC transporter ATP-binding protein [Planctomycetota bacterium]|jgi:oligopeptide/dipeptide ABC transporter ATP-binding protein